MVHCFNRPPHIDNLARWLAYADTIIGQNIAFDILCLRAHPKLRRHLNGKRHTLIDLAVLNFLQNETTPERSLKDIGPVLGLYSYNTQHTSAKFTRFPDPRHKDEHGYGLIEYNAQDTHNPLLATSEFATLILQQFPNSSKLSPYCINHYSDLIWSAIRLSEAGVPMHAPSLHRLERHSLTRETLLTKILHDHFAITCEGKGSNTSRLDFLHKCFNFIDKHCIDALSGHLGCDSLYDYKGIGYTKLTDKLQFAGPNRAYALAFLQEYVTDHRKLKKQPNEQRLVRRREKKGVPQEATHLARGLRLWLKRDRASSIVSDYTFPLLRHKRNLKAKKPLASLLVDPPRGVGFRRTIKVAYPSWYIVPSAFKDDQGDWGGQRQARMSATNPGVTKFSTPIKRAIKSRYRNGLIVSGDLSQIELRTPAILSGEPTLVNEYKKAKPDLHATRAIRVFGESIIHDPNFRCGDMTKDPRQWSKKFNFEDLYWAGALKMQAILLKDSGQLFPLDFFYSVIEDRPLLRPVLYEWQLATIAEAEKNGYLILPFTGHSRYFLSGSATNKPNEMINFKIQAAAAITMQRVQAYLHCHLPGLNHRDPPCALFANWYDANYIDCRASYAPECEAILHAAVAYVATNDYWAHLCSHYGHTVPLVIETHIARAAADD